MPKDRVKDALDHIKRAFSAYGGEDGNRAKAATWSWLESHPEVRGISELLSLGGFRGPAMFHDDDKTEMRQFQRALLLIERTLGGKSSEQCAIMKAHFVSTTGGNARAETERVKIEIRSVYSRWRERKTKEEKPRTFGEPILAPSFKYANSLQRTNMSPAFARASQLLSHAWMGFMRVGLDPKEKTRLVTWFGAYDDGRAAKVKETLKSVHDVVCARRVNVYYRGSGMPTDPKKSDTPEFLKKEGALAQGPTSAYGYVYPDVQNQGEWHVFLGKAFFQDASRHGKDSLSGVLIHEMTHLTKHTQDHVYGSGPCKTLAKAPDGPPKAVENADSYEYYCESFQSSVTTEFG